MAWPTTSDEEAGLEQLLRRYLGGFGPARLSDAADWAGVPVTKLRTPPAAVRFLPTWDATLLVHARRTQILPERFRPLVFNVKTPHSVHTFLVNGAVAGTWRVERANAVATLLLEPLEPLPRTARRELVDEGERLIRFHEPDAHTYRVRG